MKSKHSPETVIMVERTVKKLSQEYDKKGLWENLPKKVDYQEFLAIVDHLEQSNKIMICKDGIVIWTWNPERIKRMLKEDLYV
ncbi:hypothetical protein ACFL0V_03125 [Nanoarchaeota archaeon]